MSNEYKLSYTAAQINSKLGEIDYLVKEEELGSLAKKDIVSKSDVSSDIQTSLNKADTALQSFTETDPTVPSWAKSATKPAYTADEVGARPNTWMPTAADVGALPRDGSGVMTGPLHFYTGARNATLGVDDSNDYAYVQYRDNDGTSAANLTVNHDGPRYSRTLDGKTWKGYNILHTGNKNLITPWDIGAASADMSNVDMTALATALGCGKTEFKTYVGTGNYGPNGKSTLTFSFTPKFVLFFTPSVATTNPLVFYASLGNGHLHCFMWGRAVDHYNGAGNYPIYVSYSGNTMTWYATHTYETMNASSAQFNTSGVTYYVFAIG